MKIHSKNQKNFLNRKFLGCLNATNTKVYNSAFKHDKKMNYREFHSPVRNSLSVQLQKAIAHIQSPLMKFHLPIRQK